ncbi:hypothetical protein CBR_g22978 [Chara braunii]|uniref:DUF659 domain-containing protein n=1 Tax=Chara braunii TaxID=69332 RepID=A0A388L3D5_CHABU|nr:hypothetical protein CBR_g22978 [Chara braunii]|eukprot:GBG76762.1 hypothetical protein CBR_g22978 [Chara braunii]
MSKSSALKHLQEEIKKHFTIEGTRGKNVKKGSKYWRCNYCDWRLAGTATRLRDHFLERCTLDNVIVQLSVEERARREAGMSEAKCIARMLLQCEARGAGPSNMSTAAGVAGPNNMRTASSQVPQFPSSQVGGAGVTGETATPQSTADTVLGSKPSSGRPLRQTVIEEADSVITMNERTNRFLDRFLICTNQPFSLVEDVHFLEFLQAVRTAHPTWMPCRRDEQRTKRLDAEYARVGAEVRAMIVKWKKTRCMMHMDGWSDCHNKPHLNVMVSSPVGTVFWKSVCMEGKEKDSAAYFRVLDEVIKEIGVDGIVGVVMDNARVCVKAGKMVEAAYPTILSLGCTAHALDLAMEDMYKEMPWMTQVVDAGNKVGRFFSNVDKARALFHHYSPKTKLKRPAPTRFATNFEMLQSLKELWNALDRCVCDAGWVDKMMRSDQLLAMHEVTTIVLDKGDVWSNVQKALHVMQPVVELLRLVDGQGTTISKAYFKMDRVVQDLRFNAATHIPWADDVSVDKEMEEWYVRWLERVNEDVEEFVEVDFDDDGDEIPMRRTFVRNDEVDDRLVEEEETELVGTRQRDWHECTKPGKHREQELRRRSGCQLPEPGELYTEAGYALAMEARRAGTWVQGRDEAPRKRRGKGKGRQTVMDDDPPAQSGKRKAVQQEQPPPKRGRPTLAEQAARRAQVAEDKAVAAAAAAKAAADKAAKAKARAAAKAATKSAGGGKTKKSVVVSDDDDLDVPEGSLDEDEPEGSSTSSDSSSSSAASSSQSSGREGTDGEGSEGGAQFEDDEEEDRAEAE